MNKLKLKLNNKRESVRAVIDGCGRLDVRHLILLRKIQFYRRRLHFYTNNNCTLYKKTFLCTACTTAVWCQFLHVKQFRMSTFDFDRIWIDWGFHFIKFYIALYRILPWTVLYCTLLYSTVLYCITLYFCLWRIRVFISTCSACARETPEQDYWITSAVLLTILGARLIRLTSITASLPVRGVRFWTTLYASVT